MGFWDFVSYPAPRELPAMDASMGFWDWIDTRPAVSRSS
jgi:hypothetical protein